MKTQFEAQTNKEKNQWNKFQSEPQCIISVGGGGGEEGSSRGGRGVGKAIYTTPAALYIIFANLAN